MDCLRRTHKERREHRAVRRRRRVHGHSGVGNARRPCGGTTPVQCGAAAVARPAAGTVRGAACPYAPLDNSYSYAMGVLCCAWRAIWRAKLQVCCCCSKQPA